MQKLDEQKLSCAAAVTAFVATVLYYLLYVVSPSLYAFFLKARLLGANVGEVTHAVYSFFEALTGGMALATVAWVLGYVFARAYNEMHKSRGRSKR